jgi:hypothetical protein
MNNLQTTRISAVAFASVLAVSAITLMLGQEVDARRETNIVGADQSNRAAAQEGVVNAQVGLNANVQTGNVCVQALASDSEC